MTANEQMMLLDTERASLKKRNISTEMRPTEGHILQTRGSTYGKPD